MYVVSLKPGPTTKISLTPCWSRKRTEGRWGRRAAGKMPEILHNLCKQNDGARAAPGSRCSPAEVLRLRVELLKPRNVISTHRGCPSCVIWVLFSPGNCLGGLPGLTSQRDHRGSEPNCRLLCGPGADLSLLGYLLCAQTTGQAEWGLGPAHPSARAAARARRPPPTQEISRPAGRAWDHQNHLVLLRGCRPFTSSLCPPWPHFSHLN